MEREKIFVVYHKNCSDGFMAAAIAKWRYGDVVTLVGTDPSEEGVIKTIQDLMTTASPKTEMYFYDVSMTQKSFNYLLSVFPRARVFDHHKTTLECKPHNQLVCDMNHSGAVLAWNHLYPNIPVPTIVRYIEDRDLWAWKLPESRAISVWLFENFNPYGDDEINHWIDLMTTDSWLKEAVVKGNVIQEHSQSIVRKLAKSKSVHEIDNMTVYAVETSLFISEVGEALYNMTGCDYAMMWRIDLTKKLVYVSLRSNGKVPNPVDVSAIAKKYNGGGHHNAAGFTLSVEDFMRIINQNCS